MRILIVVQRYGERVLGGAETCARQFSAGLAARGHLVKVLTSCAMSNADWADLYPPGSSRDGAVDVQRIPVIATRDGVIAGGLHAVLAEHPHAAPLVQEAWARAEGPLLAGFDACLTENARDVDVAVFFTYRHATTTLGVPLVASDLPTVIHPTAHDEPALRFDVCQSALRGAAGIAYLTFEERALVDEVVAPPGLGKVIGTGLDLDPGDGGRTFREFVGIGSVPYLLYAGRIDPGKGVSQLGQAFASYKSRRPGPLLLVVAGEEAHVQGLPDVAAVGWLPPPILRSAVSGSVAVVAPSPLESFSLLVGEAWAQGRPVVANAASPVLVGQLERSRGGVTYATQEQFDDDIDLLFDGEVASWLGANGRRYVESAYDWAAVLDSYEQFLAEVIRRRRCLQA